MPGELICIRYRAVKGYFCLGARLHCESPCTSRSGPGAAQSHNGALAVCSLDKARDITITCWESVWVRHPPITWHAGNEGVTLCYIPKCFCQPGWHKLEKSFSLCTAFISYQIYIFASYRAASELCYYGKVFFNDH